MEMRFWKPFPRPDLFEIVTSQVDLVLLSLSLINVSYDVNLVSPLTGARS